MNNFEGWTELNRDWPKNTPDNQIVMVRYLVIHPNGIEAERFDFSELGPPPPKWFYDDDGYREIPTHWTKYVQ